MYQKKFLVIMLVGVLVFSVVAIVVLNKEEKKDVFAGREIAFEYLDNYETNIKDDSAIEIVKYSSYNNKLYAINGSVKTLEILKLSGAKVNLEKSINIENMIVDGEFVFGDVTSVDVDKEGRFVVVAVQESDYSKDGKALFLDLNGNYITEVRTGVQPDMITISYGTQQVLVACEGEPRKGYESGVDPEGTITSIEVSKEIKDISLDDVVTINFNNVEVDNKVIIKKGNTIEKDLEPEYIAINESQNIAYVALQENNAIAKINLETKTVEWVKGLGFKDFSISKLDPSETDGINIRKAPILGIYMPDGIAFETINDRGYIFTANEGDSREWEEYTNETSISEISDKVKLNAENYDGYTQKELDEYIEKGYLEDDKHLGNLTINSNLGKNKNDEYETLYAFGGRSFSIFDADTMELVYDSGSILEEMTSTKYPDFFNTSNNKVELDSRSTSKGPEPENVVVGKVSDEYYAFVGLERISGIVAFNVSNPKETYYVNEINTRDFTTGIAGDVGVEGMDFVSAEKSPTGEALIFTGNEVSGTAAMYKIIKEDTKEKTAMPQTTLTNIRIKRKR